MPPRSIGHHAGDFWDSATTTRWPANGIPRRRAWETKRGIGRGMKGRDGERVSGVRGGKEGQTGLLPRQAQVRGH